MTALLIIIIILLIAVLILQIWVLSQKNNEQQLSGQLEKALREESRASRQELSHTLKDLTETLESRLRVIEQNNTLQLDKMRQTVDEKLQGTLEKRLGESFQQVSRQLEQVYKGLGEMQNLASGVGDLKKVLTNVKTRGTWGEIQLGTLLEQVLSPHQFQTNVITKKNSNDRVEFAILLPTDQDQKDIQLPIDAKFPLEDYQRLLAAQDLADATQIEVAKKALLNRIKAEAKAIQEKYLDPPRTTDYAFLYLPIEGLYAEVIQQPGLVETLQTKYRVTITGPTTILALLNSFQMVFRTVAIQKRSTQVWQLLEGIKGEFGKFGGILEKTQKKLREASDQIDQAAKKSGTISRQLDRVALESPSAGEVNIQLLDSN